jgi:hypothetical protein
VVLGLFKPALFIRSHDRKVDWHVFPGVRIVDSFGPQEFNRYDPFLHLEYFVTSKVEVTLVVLGLMFVEPLGGADTE